MYYTQLYDKVKIIIEKIDDDHDDIAWSASSWITGSGFRSRLKNLKTPFLSRYQKFLSWGNLNGSKTTPKFFSKFFFNKYGR